MGAPSIVSFIPRILYSPPSSHNLNPEFHLQPQLRSKTIFPCLCIEFFRRLFWVKVTVRNYWISILFVWEFPRQTVSSRSWIVRIFLIFLKLCFRNLEWSRRHREVCVWARSGISSPSPAIHKAFSWNRL